MELNFTSKAKMSNSDTTGNITQQSILGRFKIEIVLKKGDTKKVCKIEKIKEEEIKKEKNGGRIGM